MRRVTLKRSMMIREEGDQGAVDQLVVVWRKLEDAATAGILTCRQIKSEVRAVYVSKIAA